MSLKTIKKTIYFFKTVPKCTLFADGDSDTDVLRKMFSKRFPKQGYINHVMINMELKYFHLMTITYLGLFLKKMIQQINL